ncbi:MAG TPA: ACT domain-containing protein [Chthoniobacterales bacterium]
MSIRVDRQITIALENEPGQLARVSELLATHRINIEAISILDSIEQGVIRLLVSDPPTCLQLLRKQGFYVIEGEVVVLDVQDRVGKLAQICGDLAEARINIDYVYGSVEHPGAPMRMVLKTSDIVRTRQILETRGAQA